MVEKQVGLIAYCLKLVFIVRRLYLVFNVVKLAITSKNLILSRYSDYLSNPILWIKRIEG